MPILHHLPKAVPTVGGIEDLRTPAREPQKIPSVVDDLMSKFTQGVPQHIHKADLERCLNGERNDIGVFLRFGNQVIGIGTSSSKPIDVDRVNDLNYKIQAILNKDNLEPNDYQALCRAIIDFEQKVGSQLVVHDNSEITHAANRAAAVFSVSRALIDQAGDPNKKIQSFVNPEYSPEYKINGDQVSFTLNGPVRLIVDVDKQLIPGASDSQKIKTLEGFIQTLEGVDATSFNGLLIDGINKLQHAHQKLSIGVEVSNPSGELTHTAQLGYNESQVNTQYQDWRVNRPGLDAAVVEDLRQALSFELARNTLRFKSGEAGEIRILIGTNPLDAGRSTPHKEAGLNLALLKDENLRDLVNRIPVEEQQRIGNLLTEEVHEKAIDLFALHSRDLLNSGISENGLRTFEKFSEFYKLFVESFPNSGERESAQTIWGYLSDPNEKWHSLLKVNQNNQVVAFSSGNILTASYGGYAGLGKKQFDFGWIEHTGVLDTYRGYGLGTELINQHAEMLKKAGAKFSTLEVENPTAIVSEQAAKQGQILDQHLTDILRNYIANNPNADEVKRLNYHFNNGAQLVAVNGELDNYSQSSMDGGEACCSLNLYLKGQDTAPTINEMIAAFKAMHAALEVDPRVNDIPYLESIKSLEKLKKQHGGNTAVELIAPDIRDPRVHELFLKNAEVIHPIVVADQKANREYYAGTSA